MSLLLVALSLFIYLFHLAHAASFSSTETNPPSAAGIVQAGAANQLFNLTVNNTDSSQNITQVQIATPANFTYISNSNGTSAGRTLTI